jgi:hypothetical protein
MKILIVLLLAGFTLAQNTDKNTVYSWGDALHNSFEATTENFRVRILPAKVIVSASDTVVATVDTVSRKWLSTSNTLADTFDVGYFLTITADDSIEFSTNSSFPSNNTWGILSGETYKSEIPYSVTSNPNIYIRRYSISGGTGTPRYRVRLEGY